MTENPKPCSQSTAISASSTSWSIPPRRPVTGVIDWGDMGIDDPAGDFVGLAIWAGFEPVRAAIERTGYPADSTLYQRIYTRVVRGPAQLVV